MGSFTLLPATTGSQRGAFTVTGAGSAHAALNDSSDSSYIALTSASTNGFGYGGSSFFTITPQTLPFKARLRLVRGFVRTANVGSNYDSVRTRIHDYQYAGGWYSTTTHIPTSTIQSFYGYDEAQAPPIGVTTPLPDVLTVGRPLDQAYIDNVQIEVFGMTLTDTRIYELGVYVEYDAQPVVNITAPTGTLDSSAPLVSWDYQDDFETQRAYEVTIYSGSTVMYNSGTVVSGNQSHQPLNLALADGAYTVTVRASQNFSGVSDEEFWSELDTQAFTVSSSSPAAPTVTAGDGVGYMLVTPTANLNLFSFNASTFEGMTNASAGHPDWYGVTNATVAGSASVAYARHGTRVMTVTPTGASMSTRSEWVPAAAGLSYSAGYWIRNAPSVGTTSASCDISWYKSDGTLISTSSGTATTTTTDTYVQRTITATAPALSAWAAVRVKLTATSGTYLVDDCYIGIGTEVPSTDAIRGGLFEKTGNLITIVNSNMMTGHRWTGDVVQSVVTDSTFRARIGAGCITLQNNFGSTASIAARLGGSDLTEAGNYFTTSAGEVLRVAASLYGTINRNYAVGLNFYDSSKALVDTQTVQGVLNNGSWTDVTGNVTVQAGFNIVYAKVSVGVLNTANGEAVNIDRVSVARDELANGGEWQEGTRVVDGPHLALDYSENSGTTWTALTALDEVTTADSTFRDYEVKHNTDRIYRGYTWSLVDGILRQSAYSSSSAANQISLSNVWLHAISDPQGTAYNFVYDGVGRTESIGTEAKANFYSGRDYAVVEFGEEQTNVVRVTLQLASSADQVAFASLARRKETIVFRDQRGRRGRAYLSGAQITDEVWGQTATFTVNYSGDQPLTVPS